jgi:hypothetical protein
MNWVLYIITEDFIDDEGRKIKKGEAGVGQCSMSPGICDAFNGVMYIVPGDFVRQEIKKNKNNRHPSALLVRKIIEDYYFEKEVIEISKDDKNFFLD